MEKKQSHTLVSLRADSTQGNGIVCATQLNIVYCMRQHFISIAVSMVRSLSVCVLSAIAYLKFQSIVLLT